MTASLPTPPIASDPLSSGGLGYPPGDVALAIATAALVLAGSAVVLRASALHARAEAPEIDIGAGAVVRVTPVLDPDAPLLKLGGGREKADLPDRWKAKRPRSEAPRPTGAETAVPEASAGSPAAKGPAPGDSASPDGGTGDVVAPAGPGSPEGAPEGTETDPLRARALDVYRARLIAWFSGRFRVSGSGLPRAELGRLRAGATVEISPDGRVTGYSLSPSGSAAFDAAARAALESAKGQSIPPPPENYPDLSQSRISLVFVCKEDRCD